MKKFLQSAYQKVKKEFETVPKSVWVAGTIVPFGYVAVTTYWAGKKIYSIVKKEEKDDRSQGNS